jgi:hypothetical protein
MKSWSSGTWKTKAAHEGQLLLVQFALDLLDGVSRRAGGRCPHDSA